MGFRKRRRFVVFEDGVVKRSTKKGRVDEIEMVEGKEQVIGIRKEERKKEGKEEMKEQGQ